MSSDFKKLCRIAGETISRYGLIKKNDRILAGVSGGKDSLIMMHLLKHLQSAAPIDFEVIAGSFDPGFEEFHVDRIAEYCAENHWEHHSVYMNIPEILREKHMENSPCVLCSRLRRGKLYGLAGELGCNKLALGQHLDDIAASFLMSLCRGQGLTTMAPMVRPENPGYPEVIRIMALVPEELIKRCASEFEFPEAGICRYHDKLESGDRAEFRRLVDQISMRIPDVRFNIARSLSKVETDHLLIVPGDKQ